MSSNPQVLVADDTTLVRWAVRRALNAAGFDVVEAKNRGEVLEALVAHSFQLVVLPLALMDDEVEDIARAIASAGNSALILLTENGVLPDLPRSSGRVRSVEKPFSVASLVNAALELAGPQTGAAGGSVSQ